MDPVALSTPPLAALDRALDHNHQANQHSSLPPTPETEDVVMGDAGTLAPAGPAEDNAPRITPAPCTPLLACRPTSTTADAAPHPGLPSVGEHEDLNMYTPSSNNITRHLAPGLYQLVRVDQERQVGHDWGLPVNKQFLFTLQRPLDLCR